MTPEHRIAEFTEALLAHLRGEHDVDVERQQIDGLAVWFTVWYDPRVDRLRSKVVSALSEGLLSPFIVQYVLETTRLEEKDPEKRKRRPLHLEIGGRIALLLQHVNTLGIDRSSFEWLRRFMDRHRLRGSPASLVAAFREVGVDLLQAIEARPAR